MKDLMANLGQDIKTIRLLKNIDRATLCDKAQISKNALIHLENGSGATVRTLIKVLEVLNKIDWLKTLSPVISINPLHMVKGKPRKRASQKRSKIEKHDLAHKRNQLKNKYGLSLDQYISMHADQNGKCGNVGCGIKLDIKAHTTHVDHNHQTGQVRSLLCSRCNAALGFLMENQSKMQGLIEYVKKHNK